MRMLSKTLLLALSGALSVTVAGAPAFAGIDAPDGPAAADLATYSAVNTRADLAAAYWTPERMAAAIPVPAAELAPSDQPTDIAGPQGEPGRAAPAVPLTATSLEDSALTGLDTGSVATKWRGSRFSAPASTSGKVFFVADDGGNYTCSASTVNSGGKDVVFTAGHCVHGGGPGRSWFDASTWTFAPSYNAKKKNPTPYGLWTAWQLWSLSGWTDSGDRTHDIGAAVMQTDGWGTHIVDAVGGQGIEWNWPLEQHIYQFGYPARAPFAGKMLQYCSNWTYNDGGHEGIDCNMTEGASGGPWLDDFDGTFGWLDSVNSWVFWDGNGTRYKWNGPYFGEGARLLYEAVANL